MSDTTTANEQLQTKINELPAKINVIEKALENLVVTESKVAELKEKYEGVTIADENDEDGYKLAREAKSILVKTRTSSEDDRKIALKPIDDLRDDVHARFMSVQTDLKTIEAPISSRIKEIDDIEKQRKEDARLAEEQKVENRRNELVEKGMVFDQVSGFYVIKAPELGITETSIGIVDIRTMSDDLYKNFLVMVEEKSKKISAEKERLAAIEKKAAEEKEAAEKAEREEFDRKKKLLDEQEEKMKQQQQQIKDQQDKLDQQKREAEAKEKQVEQNRINDLIKRRSAVLVGMGMKYNQSGDTYTFEEIEVSTHWITTATEGAWVESVQETTDMIKLKKDGAAIKAESLRKESVGKARFEILKTIGLIKNETPAILSDLSENEFVVLSENYKKEVKAAQDVERQAGLSDKQKMQEYIDALYNVAAPVMKTQVWKARVSAVRDYITDNKHA